MGGWEGGPIILIVYFKSQGQILLLDIRYYVDTTIENKRMIKARRSNPDISRRCDFKCVVRWLIWN